MKTTIKKTREVRVRSASFIAAVCFASALAARQPVLKSSAKTDYLAPVVRMDTDIDRTYQRLLTQKLFVGPADYARLLITPPGIEGEGVVTIYSRDASNKNLAHVTYTKNENSLWHCLSESGLNSVTCRSLGVTRLDADIPATTAVAVSNAWKSALSQVRQQPLVSSAGDVILDGTEMEFSLDEKNGKRLSGLLTPYSNGARTQTLRHIGNLLVKYCTDERDRHALASEIETEANNIIAIHGRSQSP